MRNVKLLMAMAVTAASLLPGAGQAQSGQAMTQTCFICHGPGGHNEGGTIATIAGLPKEHLARQLTDFKADRRPGTIMNRIVKGYSHEQLQAIVEYLATLK